MQGTGVPIVTPCTESGEIDTDRLTLFSESLEAAGIDFVVPCGSTSEAPLLTAKERKDVIETVVDATECPVLAGTGYDGFEETMRATNDAATAGADAALILTPHYYPLTDEEYLTYFTAIADHSPLPIYLYSVPAYTDVNLSPSVIGQLATHDNIHGIKDSSGDLTTLQRTLTLTDDAEFAVLTGSGNVYALSLSVGAAGGILALANVVPELATAIYRLAQEGQKEEALQMNQSLVELNVTITNRFGVRGVKAALEARDRAVGPPRSPLASLSKEDAAEVQTVLQDALNATAEGTY